MNRKLAGVALALAMALIMGQSLKAQYNPRARLQPVGLGVSPTFEGWYKNPNGTYTLSFGYINRNTQEVLTIPPGTSNWVDGGSR